MSSIYGIGYPTRPLTNAPAQPREQAGARRDLDQAGRMRPGAPAPALRPTIAPAGDAGAQAAPLEAPPGTDPELWKVLSTEERGYFAKLGAMGPLTYGRMVDASRQMPSVRGGRLDVKV